MHAGAVILDPVCNDPACGKHTSMGLDCPVRRICSWKLMQHSKFKQGVNKVYDTIQYQCQLQHASCSYACRKVDIVDTAEKNEQYDQVG